MDIAHGERKSFTVAPKGGVFGVFPTFGEFDDIGVVAVGEDSGGGDVFSKDIRPKGAVFVGPGGDSIASEAVDEPDPKWNKLGFCYDWHKGNRLTRP